MKIDYKINNKIHKVIFCPDREGLKIKKKKKSYMRITNDLNKIYNDKNILLILDKKIDKKITRYLIHDLKISYPNLKVLFISGSKKNKNVKLLFKIVDYLFKLKFTKKSVIISCGGGVVGDICGLAASLYYRGLIHFHIPTTITAIIDSCIGGKTGINYNGIINSLGNYYHPERVYISKNIINLIPDREYFAGIPEILKCGLINNNRIIQKLYNKYMINKRNFKYMTNLIKASLNTKLKFFINDITEINKRMNLNFGHTFAHAIEMSLQSQNKEFIRHGEAVGIGLLCEIYYSSGKNHLFNLTHDVLTLYNLPTNLKKFTKLIKKSSLEKNIYKNIFLDKKKISKFPRYIKLKSIGKSYVSEMRDNKRIIQTIKEVLFNN